MVARLYPHDFNLAQEWEQAVEQHPQLRRFGVDGLELLRLIALRENLREFRASGTSTVKGIRQGDVLKLDPDLFVTSGRKLSSATSGRLSSRVRTAV